MPEVTRRIRRSSDNRWLSWCTLGAPVELEREFSWRKASPIGLLKTRLTQGNPLRQGGPAPDHRAGRTCAAVPREPAPADGARHLGKGYGLVRR